MMPAFLGLSAHGFKAAFHDIAPINWMWQTGVEADEGIKTGSFTGFKSKSQRVPSSILKLQYHASYVKRNQFTEFSVCYVLSSRYPSHRSLTDNMKSENKQLDEVVASIRLSYNRREMPRSWCTYRFYKLRTSVHLPHDVQVC